MSKRFIDFFVPFLFLINLAFIFYQLWKIAYFDQSTIQLQTIKLTAPKHYIHFPAEDNVEKINKANFFGCLVKTNNNEDEEIEFKVGSLQKITDDAINHLPETHLAGKIVGLLLSDNDKKSLVVIEYAGQQVSYSTGEHIIGSNIVILRILADKILLNENGYYAKMTLK